MPGTRGSGCTHVTHPYQINLMWRRRPQPASHAGGLQNDCSHGHSVLPMKDHVTTP